jgi:hypothetical protein
VKDARNPQKSVQLVLYAIRRVLEMRYNRAIKPVLPSELVINKNGKTHVPDSLNLCHCGAYYKRACKSCAGRISRAKQTKKNLEKSCFSRVN